MEGYSKSGSRACGHRCDPWMLLKPETDPGFTYDCQTNRMMGPRTAQYRYRSRLDRCLRCQVSPVGDRQPHLRLLKGSC